ncbi:MAG: hypothetical protein FK732_00875 [Asgard group archaeon]|nr:hypothetical protein [Asgard group archaeon]
MWIHYNFLCDVNTQIRIHKIFRSKINEWFGSLIDGSVLTYHYAIPRKSNDSLYVCLKIPSLNVPIDRRIQLSSKIEKNIPEDIRIAISELSSEYLIDSIDKLEKRDYEYDLTVNNSSAIYKTSVNGILNFASKGTKIALNILNDNRTKQEIWKNDLEFGVTIKQLVQAQLNSENERRWGLHFVFNSLCFPKIVETYMRRILDGSLDGQTNYALNFLYEIETSGDIKKTVRFLTPVMQLIRLSNSFNKS